MKNVIFRLPASFLLTAIFIFTTGFLFSQNAPIIVNDTIDVEIGEFISMNPVLNDYDPDGDIFLPEVAFFLHGSGSVAMFGSNFEIQINNNTYNLKDTIRYVIKDQNGEMSAPGYVIVNIAPSNIRDTLDINNVSAPFAAWGTDFYSPVNSMNNGYRVPKGSNTTTIFTSSLWMAGHDSQNVLHSSSKMYDSYLGDYMYGPVKNTIGDREAHDGYNRVWKVTKAQIDYHKLNFSNPSYVMPDVIANWPAHGDVSKGEGPYLAPFVDIDNDGNYNTQIGDYPDIKGDECILSIINDNISRNGFNNTPLKVDIIQMAYAYNCPDDTALNHTIFMHYDIFNRSQNTYSDFLIGNFYDFDIGDAGDDFQGCDSIRNTFFAYNSNNNDIGPSGYGFNPPVQGVRILNHSLSSFNVFYNPPTDSTLSLGPSTSDQLYNNLAGKFNDGTPITVGAIGQSGTVETKYFYNGDINDPSQWSEVSVGNVGHDSRALGNIGPFNFAPNQKISLDVAMIYTRGINKTNLQNVDLLLQHSDYIQDIYDGIITPACMTIGLNEITTPEVGFNIYPNPTNGDINIKSNIEFHNADYKVYSMIGQFVSKGVLKNNTETISVRNLQTGIYFLSITDGSRTYSQKFVVK